MFGYDTKSTSNKTKTQQVELHQTKKQKRKFTKYKGNLQNGRNFTNHISEKWLVSKVYMVMQNDTATMENSMEIPLKKKLGINLPYDPIIPLLGIYPEETITEKDTCTPVLIAALFTIARTWKQSSCPSTDEWIKKLWYIYTMEYYSAIKKECI